MKKWRSFISALLAGIMILSAASGIFAAPVFTDVSSHWAWTRGYIPYLVEKNVLNGYALANGTSVFKPEDKVTRAEFIKMLDETFGLTAKDKVSYTDVKESDWFHPYFAKAIAQGYILNYGSYATPNGELTREEAITLLVRYLDLTDAEKAPANSLADYSTINDYYKDPVLAAVKAGLIEGYAENGRTYFKPKNTLTRAEALTILYRAAGAIYNTSVSKKDSGAADTNAVITKGGVILSGMTLNGRVIVTEGVSGDSVVFSDTYVSDTLYIRGASNVIIDGNKVKNLVVESSTPGILITVSGNATVNSLTVNSNAKVTIASGSTVDELNVNAKNVSVTGTGVIHAANVTAAGLVCSIMPDTYDIAVGQVATFDGNVYEGSSDYLAAFVFAPYLSEEEGHYYLNISPTVNGQISYFYTNATETPSSKEFDSDYLSAKYRGYFSVTANKIYSESTGLSYQVEDYKYIAIQLSSGDRNYAPIMLKNEVTSGTGFIEDPVLIDDTTVSFTPEYSGTVYYYYTDSMDEISTAKFLGNYKDADKELKGSVSASANRDGKITLNSRYLENHPYVAVVLQNGSGTYFAPVIVAAGDSGFKEEPKLSTLGTITFTTNIDGTLYYYYSISGTAPSAAGYNDAWREGTGRGQVRVTKNHATSLDYDSNLLASNPYIIFSIKDNYGNYTKPYVLHMEKSSGFQIEPYISGASEVSFKTTTNGTVYWYMSKDGKAPATAAAFTTAYTNATSRRGSTTANAASMGSFTYPSTYASTYPYLVIRLQGSNGTEYLPVVLDIQASTDTGFSIEPYADPSANLVYFKTSEAGNVYYYFARKTYANIDYTQDFKKMYDNTNGTFKGKISVGSIAKSIDYSAIDLDKFNVLVLCFINGDGVEHIPVAVELTKSDDANVFTYGLEVISVEENTIKVLIYDTGTLYYAGQLTSSLPNNAFIHGASSMSVTADKYVDVPIDPNYNYMALKLGNYKPLVVNTFKKNEGEDITGGANTGGSGFISCTISFDQNSYPVFTFTPKVSGTVKISASTSGPTQKVVEVVANETYSETFNYSIQDLINAGLGNLVDNFTYYVQLTSGDTVYTRVTFPVG
ncbi:MAG: S-layer homology domain-containing protein [Ruminococcaceae bacterium]|nr:S-layer homology domain-containing protein [Oscillospiraceae bacterium]